MKTRSALSPLLLAALAATLAAPAASYAQRDANVERGFAPEKLYERGITGIDHVNEFNGNLLVTIPIGPTFSVNGGLSYGLTLVYNAKVWNMYSAAEEPHGPLVDTADLEPTNNAGIGWRLSLGELLPSGDPGNSSGLRYVGPDGGEHSFTHPTLHFDAGEPIVEDIWYSRDGSYLRLQKVADSPPAFEVESGDGTIRSFVSSGDPFVPYRLNQIRDRFGNAVDINLVTGSAWEIDDGHRTHLVHFKTVAGRQVVDKVVLAAFDGTTATYTFGYADTNTTIHEHCGDNNGEMPVNRPAALLTSVTLPANGGSYQTGGTSGYHTTCFEGGVMIKDLPGALRRLKLPTGGELAWTYQNHAYPMRGIFVPGEPSLQATETLGIKTRQVLDFSGSCVGGCTWTYEAGQTGSAPNWRRWVRVTSPSGDDSVYHFDLTTALSTSTWTGWEYGMPFNKSSESPNGSGYFLSQEIYQGSVSPSNKRRSIYVGYEHDKLPSGTTVPSNWYNTNRRVVREKTVYHDDKDVNNNNPREATVVYSSFDGVGHYRTRTLGGTFDAGNVRTETTNYNGALGIYQVNQANNQQTGSYTPWGAGSPWVLGNYDSRTVTENGQTAKEEYCFQGSTGYLQRKRILRAGTVQNINDLLSVYGHDQGNTTLERRFGGDLGTVGTGALCSLALSANQYRIEHTYQYGSLATSQLTRGDATPLEFRSVDRTIDNNTGLPSSSRDTALVETTYSYDALGRLTQETPANDARTTYTYHSASGASGARVVVRRIANGGSTVRTEAEYHFDPFGRLAVEKRKQASGTWSKRTTFHDNEGRTTDVSEWEPDGSPHTAFTKYRDFDPFGRPTRIEPPDGAAHEVDLTYVGVRVVDRAVSVATGANGVETSSTTREIYDRQGRLHQVKEPSGTAGAEVITTYGYDEAGRLTSVDQGADQDRSFSYDNRGFLTQECHPEKGAFGNGCVTYSSYNVWGLPGRTTDGPNDLRILYDRAGRQTEIKEAAGAQRPLKAWTYGTGIGTADRSRGKVKTAERYNYVFVGATPFTDLIEETYTYGGRGGRISARLTDNYINPGPTPVPSDSFTQGFVWNDLGDPESLDYPYRLGLSTAPSVTFGYSNGVLTSVPGYASSITFHPNGMLHQVARTNGVTDTWNPDPNRMQRPASIEAWRGATPLFLTGIYSYDGAGNVEKIGSGYFVYDKVSRLTEGRIFTGPGGGGTQVSQTYGFDPYGNITSIVTNGVTRNTPTSPSTNRLTSATYDAAGNVTGHNGAVYQYGPFNDMWRYQNGAEEAIFLYTADGERLWEFNLTPGKPINRWTLRDLGGKVLREYEYDRNVGWPNGWTVERDYVYRNGTLLAAQTPQGVQHFSVDHLGTPRLVTNGAGSQVAYHAYYPFGEEATAFNQDAERMKFTGHERDLHSAAGAGDDLDYMHARFCSPMTGRFLAFDSAKASVTHGQPQSWNRYAYTIGNPLKYVDPTGKILRLAGTEGAKQKAIEIANSGLFGVALTVDSSGNAELEDTGVQGPPTPQQAEMARALGDVIGDTENTIAINLSEGSETAMIGGFESQEIDVTDLGTLGTGAGANQAAAFAHEVAEQYEKQVHGRDYATAHQTGNQVEQGVSGYVNVDNTVVQQAPGYLEILRGYEGAEGRVEVTVVIGNGNLIEVRRVTP